MKQLTFQDIVDMNPCSAHSPEKYIPMDWTGTILDILKLTNVAPAEKLWVAYKVLDELTLRLFAVTCARRAISLVKNPDQRSLAAIDIAELYAHGRVSKEELTTAYVDAYTAAAHAAYAAPAAIAAAAAASAAAAANAAYAYASYAAHAAAAHTANASNAASAAAATAAAYTAAYTANATNAYASYAAHVAAQQKERQEQIDDLIKLIQEKRS